MFHNKLTTQTLSLSLTQRLKGSVVIFLIAVAGCLGPSALHRTMIEYDKYYQNSETDLLLLNIARLDQGDSPHFTILTSINNSISFGGVLSSQVSFSSGANNLA